MNERIGFCKNTPEMNAKKSEKKTTLISCLAATPACSKNLPLYFPQKAFKKEDLHVHAFKK
jgi:hypothetical protein